MPGTENGGSRNSLASLEAFIAGLEGSRQQALDILSQQPDALSIRRRFALLLEANEINEIADGSLKLDPASEWVDLAILALAATDNTADAVRFFSWAKSQNDRALEFRCAISLADGTMRAAFKNVADGAPLVPGALSQEQRSILSSLEQSLEPTFQRVASQGSIDVEVQAQFLIRQLDVTYLLGNREKAERICELLLTRRPIPIKLGQAAIQGLTKSFRVVLSRLREDHPTSFQARFLACVIEARRDGKYFEAYNEAFALRNSAQTTAEKEELCELLYELSAEMEHQYTDAVLALTSELCGPASVLYRLFIADSLVRSGKGEEAVTVLEDIPAKEDPRWIRISANAQLRNGNEKVALDLFISLSLRAPSPDAFRAIADLAGKRNERTAEINALTSLLALEPADVAARNRLAKLWISQEEFGRAIEQLTVLHQVRPQDEVVAVNLAVAFFFSGDIENALQTLNAIPPEKQMALPVLTAKAQVLQAANRAEEGFRHLTLGKEKHWAIPEFVFAYMNMAYATGHEDEAHSAFVKLQELQAAGQVDEKMMWAASLEEVSDWIKGAAERRRTTAQMVREGKMPWVMAAELGREVPYWAWLLKTQPFEWIADDPDSQTGNAIYATNGYRVFEEKGVPRLTQLTCPKAGTPVAVDISALITLQELDLLDAAGQYFKTLYIPAAYVKRAFEQARKLVPHQLSQKAIAETISSLVQNGQIRVANDSDGSIPALIDEYEEHASEPQGVFHIADIANTLHRLGHIDDRGLERARLVAHKPATSAAPERQLAPAQKVQVTESTLGTLARANLLTALVKAFEVTISIDDYEEVKSRIRAFTALDSARTKHVELWNRIRTNPNFHIVPVRPGPEIFSGDEDKRYVSLVSLALAKEKNIPLFVDDRVCQALILNERKDVEDAAFGSDQFIEALEESQQLGLSEVANYTLKLIDWRYKFLVVRPEILKELAERYRAHPPGEPLRRIARYVHLCMQDVGLFAGMEPTSPPTTVAMRLHQDWVYAVAEFLMAIWMDKNASVQFAEEVTRWSVAQLLPSPPRAMADSFQSRAAAIVPRSILSRALISSSGDDDANRVNQGLRCIANAIGLDENEYMEIVTGVTIATTE